MKTIDELIKERDEFLDNHPHLREYQDELDLIMANLDPADRLVYLGVRMHNNINKLKDKLNELSQINQT